MFLKSILNNFLGKIFVKKNTHKVKQTVPTIREAILSQEGTFTVGCIVSITGKSRGSIGEILRELRDKGVLVKYKNETWEKRNQKPPIINWDIPPIGTKQSVVVDGPALNALIRKTILCKTKLFTVPSIKSQLRIEDENGRVQRVVYTLIKEGLVKKVQEKDTTHSTPANLYEVIKKGM